MSTFKPLGDRIAVRPLPAEEKTSSGLYIPDTAKEKPQQGTVVAVGPGRTEDGTHVEMSVREGDRVLYGKYAGTDLVLDDEELLIMKESDVLGRLDD
jgi:chaperonin GroES